MIKVRLIGPGGDSDLHTVPSKFVLGVDTLITVSPGFAHGVFKATTVAVAGTSIIAAPDPGGRIILTDLILTTDKTANSSVAVNFEDGTNTVTIVGADSANAPVNLAIPFAGNWEGWVDARVEMVVVADVAATLALGYTKLSSGLAFAEWDGLR